MGAVILHKCAEAEVSGFANKSRLGDHSVCEAGEWMHIACAVDLLVMMLLSESGAHPNP